MTHTVEELLSALDAIPASIPRTEWVIVGMAFKAGGGTLDQFNVWSSTGSNYLGFNDVKSTWDGLKEHGGITVQTLFKKAREYGWKGLKTENSDNAGPTRPRPRPTRGLQPAPEDADKAAKQAKAAHKARAAWAAGLPAAGHPYQLKKGIQPTDGLRQITSTELAKLIGYTPKAEKPFSGKVLMVPFGNAGGITTLEFIDETGQKRAIKDGQKSGSWWPPIKPAVDKVLLAEGVATALSAHEATGVQAFSAGSVGNLAKVAAAFKELSPGTVVVILADLGADGGAHPEAVKAAQAVGASLAVPDFGPERTPDQTDFNDLHQSRDLDAVRVCIEGAEASERQENPGDGQTCVGGKYLLTADGVFLRQEKGRHLWLCAPLHVAAKGRDREGNQWSILVQWLDQDGKNHERVINCADLVGKDRGSVVRALVDGGLKVSPGRDAAIAAYILETETDARFRIVTRTGWTDEAYILPGSVISQEAHAERYHYANQHSIEPELHKRGELSGWRSRVAALAAGNSRLVFAISLAFAGPLLELSKLDSGGFHLIGRSSTGKSKTLMIAASVWGSERYIRLWRTTGNALEGLASVHNDGLLILDELKQIDPREAGNAAYLLANGQAKARANSQGNARAAATWRLLFLSAGELSLETHIATSGQKTQAGQVIRMPDISADAGQGMGIVEQLHGSKTSKAFIDEITKAARDHHGHAGPEFLRYIVERIQEIEDAIRDEINRLCFLWCAKDTTGQLQRVAARFALVAVAGELATKAGITGWNTGEATAGAKRCFESFARRFGAGEREETDILRQVRLFLELHGSSRFSDRTNENEQRTVTNRAGFYDNGPTGRIHYVLPEAFRAEVCKGLDHKQVASILAEKGWLKRGPSDSLCPNLRMGSYGPTRVYVLLPEATNSDLVGANQVLQGPEAPEQQKTCGPATSATELTGTCCGLKASNCATATGATGATSEIQEMQKEPDFDDIEAGEMRI